ncbi:E3 ubiquitin-protein ligase HECTD3-like isoform X2 [Mytilus edulis]|uniref:E3 ubiquitin-protein ligase HECTD3-like isoform X2 n=1 Tax=Mytilus edulis TaxID=6550 RepID=UPI0039F113B3
MHSKDHKQNGAQGSSVDNLSGSRRRLARIRCILECIQCLKERKKFPACICFVPSEVEYKCQSKTTLRVYPEPLKNSRKIKDLHCTTESRVVASGEEYCNSQGKWLRIKRFRVTSNEEEKFDNEAWIQQFSSKSSNDEAPVLVPVDKALKRTNPISNWEEVVEQHFAIQLPKKKLDIMAADEEAVDKLRQVPANWSIECEEALVRLMSQHIPPENDHLGSIKNYVEAVDVSSCCDESTGSSPLTDGDPDTYWESDGSAGRHWIELKMKKGAVISELKVTLDGSDDNYLPRKLVVEGGEPNNFTVLNTVNITWEISDVEDIPLLENSTEHYPYIMIRIKECKCEYTSGGIDTRIREIKITASEGRYMGFDMDVFKKDNLVRFPKLESYTSEQLYRRSILIQRFISILDNVLKYLVPSWKYSVGSYSSLEFIRQLLPLSKKRMHLIETFVKESATERPSDTPKLYINRRAAMEHRCEPGNDPDFKNSIFSQIYEGLKPRDRNSKCLDYRWSSRFDQWWECKFMSEGVIDQGGGFRDSLSDLSEELCPVTSDAALPLPFFIRSPNQVGDDSNIHRDVYILNHQCRDFTKYEWIGQLMGACLRGKENLVLSFPPLIWKMICGERVTWTRDYHTVDAAEVKLIDQLETMDKETFSGAGRIWSTTMTDGTPVELKVDGEGNPLPLDYDDRQEYCNKVRQIRMSEFDQQISAIRKGLLKTVPQAVFDLLTWQELEHRISGNPDITIEALKRSVHYDDIEEDCSTVKYMWQALEKFSTEDRSRFLRFVTGRKRLPAPIYVSSGKTDAIDCLPESSTCANMLYIPTYTSAKIAEQKLRYAVYNCTDIDLDLQDWGDSSDTE